MDEKEKAQAEMMCDLIRRFNTHRDTPSLTLLVAFLLNARVCVPMTVSMEEEDLEKILASKAGDTVTTGGAIRMKPDMLKNDTGELFFPAFTTKEETPESYRKNFSWITMDFMDCVRKASGMPICDGLVLNGFSEPFVLSRALMQLMMDYEKTQEAAKKRETE